MNTRKPNFFLIGAPKCGTTSMDEWLKAHPRIFTPDKESHHFNTDHADRTVTDAQDYDAMFAQASEQHIAVGEASVRYLYSHEAVANILRYNPQAVFIVMLRNPVEMAYSWHNQLYLSYTESEQDFQTAWNLQTERKAGRQIPGNCTDVKKLFYGDICCLGEQVRRLYEQVPRERVHVVVFDDLKTNPGEVYRAALKFLQVPDDHKQDFEIHNPAKVHLFRPLNRFVWLLGGIKKALGIRKGFGILEAIRTRNKRVKPRAPMSPDMRRTLVEYFYDDVRLLESLIERDLSHWGQ